ncbi:hypothetical protein [Novosphingobium silvae]|jgi:hypothetical protein|uniref:hypothetical protein n=1 Tax=Novosphingobium silvae TaxID=2692619 RepID=UPI0019265E32|nr:hypothetical protein [Novosphingobium silvae]
MNIGAEIPFRRSRRERGTGSLILDHQREEHLRENRAHSGEMRVWSKERFVQG